jgi:HPt (histidine-containing phosphotransfer) domain-containing protein
MIVNRYVRNKEREKELGLTGKKPEAPAGVTDEKAENKQGILTGRSLEGIDFSSGLKRFDDNEETYLKIISSYLAQVQTITEKIRSSTAEAGPSIEALGEYRIMVHSLKSTSYTIGARHIGSMAEEMENAAAAGDMKYINAHSGALIESLEKLIPILKNFLDEIQNADQRPLREAPNPALLARLLKASVDYDMEQMDAVMNELEQYRYKTQADLVDLLRQEFGKSEFESIQKHLESLNIKIE